MAVANPKSAPFIGRYRLLLELGRGGMARVYLGESLDSLRKLVVLKVLNQELAIDADMRQAFTKEARLSARLNHPKIVNVHEVFEQGTTAVMVMEYLEGMSLSEINSRLKGAIPLKLHLSILGQLLDALHYFHELKDADGVSLECVHRDVSPDNVMVLHEGGIKVVDFGVAKVRAQSDDKTRGGVVKGKLGYMPPEQLLACANVDRRADIYAVGVMLWEAVAGRRMWRGMDAARMRAVAMGELPDIRQAAPGVSDALAKIIERALMHAPDARYATAEEMLIELEQISLTEGGHSAPRELAEFMRTNFGEERRQKKRDIEKIVLDSEYSLAHDSVTFIRDTPSASGERSSNQIAEAAPTVSSTPFRKPMLFAGLIGAVCIGAAAVVTLRPADELRSPVMQPDAQAAPVTLRVNSEPPGAQVYLDGVEVGVTPLVQTRTGSAQAMKLELRSAGQVVESQMVTLQNDLSLNFASRNAPLSAEPREEPTEPTEETAKPTEEATSVGERNAAASAPHAQDRGQVVTRPRRPALRAAISQPAAAAASATPAPKANAADSCDPPYRIDPGGVKVFKPHCF